MVSKTETIGPAGYWGWANTGRTDTQKGGTTEENGEWPRMVENGEWSRWRRRMVEENAHSLQKNPCKAWSPHRKSPAKQSPAGCRQHVAVGMNPRRPCKETATGRENKVAIGTGSASERCGWKRAPGVGLRGAPSGRAPRKAVQAPSVSPSSAQSASACAATHKARTR